jgi:hypothetical protein
LPAPETMTVVCGGRSLPWLTFRAAWWAIDVKSKPSDVPAAMKLRERFREIYSCFRTFARRLNFSDARFLYSSCKCSDPRDRVYAVLRLLDPALSLRIRPDYGKSVEEVYTDAVVADFGQASSAWLDVLAECELDEAWTGPSWVPNWASPATNGLKDRGNSFSALYIPGVFELDDKQRLLSAAGVSIGVVDKVQKLDCVDDLASELVMRLVRETVTGNQAGKFSTHCASPLDDLLRCLCGDYLAEFADLGRSLPLPCLADIRATVENSMESPELQRNPLQGNQAWTRYCNEVTRFTSGTFLFQTVNGFIGICPPIGRIGDVVCVIPGSRNPLLIRPSSYVDNTERYAVVGSVFMASFAHSEAYLGPLDSGTEVLWRRTQTDVVFRVCPGSAAQAHNDWTHEDPRWKKLPIDLSEYRKELRTNYAAVPRINSVKNGIKVTVESWKKLGVDVRIFDLI